MSKYEEIFISIQIMVSCNSRVKMIKSFKFIIVLIGIGVIIFGASCSPRGYSGPMESNHRGIYALLGDRTLLGCRRPALL